MLNIKYVTVFWTDSLTPPQQQKHSQSDKTQLVFPNPISFVLCVAFCIWSNFYETKICDTEQIRYKFEVSEQERKHNLVMETVSELLSCFTSFSTPCTDARDPYENWQAR